MVLQNAVSKTGFELVYKNDLFKCAFITQNEQYAPGKISCLKRHNKSDEIFVLIQGKAVLLTGEQTDGEYDATELQFGRSYCVTAGTWHYMAVSDDAKVFVVENADVSKENTDELNIEEQNIILAV